MKNRILILFVLAFAQSSLAQIVRIDSGKYPKVSIFTTQQDHDNMKATLGIKNLRSGPSGNEFVANHANYDEALANPCPQLPDILTLNNGKKVTTLEIWNSQRKPELMEEFEKNVYGRIPKNVPKVTWTVKITDRESVNRTPVIAKELVGHVDNSDYSLINVDIKMVLVVPTNVKGPVPVLMMLGRPVLPAPAQPSNEDLESLNVAFKEMMIKSNPEMKAIFDKYPAYQPITKFPTLNFFAPPKPDEELTPQERLLAAGWGYVTIDPSSIQADNGASFTRKSNAINVLKKGNC